jgi:hypothetical protein
VRLQQPLAVEVAVRSMQVIGHGRITPWEGAGDQGQKRAVVVELPPCPPGPPDTWTASEFGEPRWLLERPGARQGGWVVIAPARGVELPPELRALRDRDARSVGASTWAELSVAPSGSAVTSFGPAMLPALTWLSPRPHRRGRPRRQYGRGTRDTARCAAWLADVCRWPITKIAQRLTSPSLATLDHVSDTSTQRRDARLYVRAGRVALAEEGVLPWVCWDHDEDGRELPEGDLAPDWWWDEWFLTYLDIWFAHAESEAASRSVASGTLELPATQLSLV